MMCRGYNVYIGKMGTFSSFLNLSAAILIVSKWTCLTDLSAMNWLPSNYSRIYSNQVHEMTPIVTKVITQNLNSPTLSVWGNHLFSSWNSVTCLLYKSRREEGWVWNDEFSILLLIWDKNIVFTLVKDNNIWYFFQARDSCFKIFCSCLYAEVNIWTIEVKHL